MYRNWLKLHLIAITNSKFLKSIVSDVHYHIAQMYINFHQNRVSIDQSKQCTQSYLQKNRKLHKYATYNSNFETKLLSDMYHRITYMYINFQQNRVSRSVKTVHTNLFANNRKLHKFATCNTNFKKSILSDMNHLIPHIYADFKINRFSRSVRTAFQSYFYRGRTDGRTDGQTDGRTDRHRE